MKIFITRVIPDRGVNLLRHAGHTVDINPEDRVLSHDELILSLQKDAYGAVLCDLDDKIDPAVLDAAGPQCKIFANYAVGYDNLDLPAMAQRGIAATNTPGVLTNAVAEHALGLLLGIAHRIPEADRYTRAGKFTSWGPTLLLGSDVSGRTLGIVGLGRIGSRVAHHAARGFDMPIVYYDVKRSEEFEKSYRAAYRKNVDDVFAEADYISIHVPLLPTTRHLVDASRLALMKKSAYLINTSRGAVIDETALVAALQNGAIRGAALDVYEHEPALTPGLADLENVILTPHIASATEETRQAMSEIAAQNILAVLDGRIPPNVIKG
ncbi:MAG: D-glycerate dehydrogenase [Candidatus Sungbacteria bacterium RIFCSPLOWO2_02_FULL_54_10]|uniref:D-glycerate dehydrogenase n=2 Tax=Candidatus Sungiibacteriota TaxID=1817917 RepID=A0A1G2L5F4_9BACT|nr:MAG: D-glycerate dehydrogenase [Candidatus Sungbacteria bacterium RIFCSPHIGHO2_02_FULL_53_17]OHA06895.1 MAG: D-glycerate dehydrogenase [Candidatus Sungbacteria bacterium RIFCSPLOWO2_01_FULL_54_21]OHA13473.1 MAG: D-glycerate dehydrogenase [Candidatus Sungbacteria bacterium RIFCSPLOWO2_02_FULL_54_10]